MEVSLEGMKKNKVKVALLETSPETVVEDYGRLLEMAEFKKYLIKGASTILKDNISWHLFFPGANTTPWQLEGVIKKLKESEGFDEIVVVENETVVTNAEKGEKLNRLSSVLKKYNIPVKYNFKDEDMKWVVYEPKGKMRVLDKIYKEGIKIPDFFFKKNIIHLPTVKTHIYSTTTCSMKNAFGGLLNTKRHYTHSVIHETLVDLLQIQKEIHSGIFAVADGTTCGNGPGPRTMFPVIKNLIIASGDCVALDAVASRILGFDPLSIPYIRIAHQASLGVGDLNEIEIVGDDIERFISKFYVGDNLPSRVGDIFWFSPLKFIQKFFFHTPLVNIFILASYIYHDYLWYNFKGKKRVKEWMKSEWGKLFERY